ncbi:phosphoribosylglycinamide formyltransferase [Agriterribacter sp.]|uniref:phosphoribosylglycinamide formyltransferase n=1 Tax=Agriterribacter sp. TaxID=2821509 RepID=UPI002BF0E729|nr:phosphoribosylglycinamide formyltransferase [Agriterribacter sp.]HRP58572.1 phosphoribosylglycinamide formyltransferase [Agriterribacter sp.]
MLRQLQKKWGVSNTQFLVILCVFAITGTTTAYITGVITTWAGFTEDTFWLWRFLLRLAILIFGYQAILLTVAFLFGQFPFFWKYEKKILKRIGIKVEGVRSKAEGHHNQKFQTCLAGRQVSNIKLQTVHIAIFASGTGSNAQKIIDHFRDDPSVAVSLVVSNKPAAGVLNIAERENIPSLSIEKERFFRGDAYVSELKTRNIQWIILAGFLWKVPTSLIHAFPGRIINIHPALLPKYGGKGMYGHFVHEAVIGAKEKESGITIHYVDEQFDHGRHIFQLSCPVNETDTPETLAQKIQVLEHKHYPEVIAGLINDNLKIEGI